MTSRLRLGVRRFFLASLVIGLLLSIYGEVRLSAEPVAPVAPTELVTLAKVWKEERALGNAGDAQAMGLAAFQIALGTHAPEWSGEALRQYQSAKAHHTQNAQLHAYTGAAHSLVARDFPVAAALQVFIGPGFIRLYHVWQAVSQLNAAVAMAPTDPVVRLVRGSTLLGIPQLFGQRDKGLADLRLLQEWLLSPQGIHADVLTNKAFQSSAWVTISGAFGTPSREEGAQ